VVETLVKESRRVIVIADKERTYFYRLLGFSEIHSVSGPSEALKLIEEYKAMRDVSVILVEESIMQALGLDYMTLNEKGLTPLVTIIPDTKEALTRNPNLYYRRLVLRVVGYEVSG
jgi:vacuolar-type H+-ATPase subunit F/Vma7